MERTALILDFGSQYTKLIARRVRELNVFSEIVPFDISLEAIHSHNPGVIILSGGPSSVYDRNAPGIDERVFSLDVPILGICYGLQLIARASGMRVEAASSREYGLATLETLPAEIDSRSLLADVQQHSRVWMSHGDKITQYPDDFHVTGRTSNSEIAVIESPARKIYGVQFHPEVVHTEEGRRILSNFLFSIAGLSPTWNMGDFIKNTVSHVRKTVGSDNIVLGLSGGVDSTVLALLLKRAVGDRLFPVFINTGLLRYNEFEDLQRIFKEDLGLNVIAIDASDKFLERLKGVRSPEKKRKIIGKTFIDVFATVEKQIGSIQYFAQGTLYPDVIESVSVNGPSVTIKSHHNVGGLPEKMDWTMVEPFKELFKDEVREIGRKLGLADRFINRHPFPGPGLAVRILGAVNETKVRRLQLADAILQEEMHRFKIYDSIWQAFVVLLPVRTVGVMGDERTYENVAVLRLVESIDGMTADWFVPPIPFLKKVSSRIVNEVKGINRVTYDLTSKPPGTIEWE